MSSAAGRPASFATVALAAGLVLTSLLLALAFLQSRDAHRMLLAGRLLAAAEELYQNESAEPETPILLALESYRLDPTVRSLDLLRALLDPLSPRPAIRVPLGSEQAVWRLHPGGESLALLDHGKLRVIQITSGRVERAFDTGNPLLEALSPDGLTVAAVSPKGRITVWDVRSGRTIDSWVCSQEAKASLLISNDARVLALIDRDASVHVIKRPLVGSWNETRLPPPATNGKLGPAEARLADDGSRLSIWYVSWFGLHEARCAWRLYDTRTGKVHNHHSNSEPNCEGCRVLLSPSGRYLTELADGNLAIHSDGAPILPSQDRRVGEVKFSPGESLVAVEEAAAIRVANIGAKPQPAASREIALPRTVDGETVLSISDALPNRGAVLVTQDRNRVAIRELPSGETVSLVPFPDPVRQATLTSDRRFLVASTRAALFVQRLDGADRRILNHDSIAIRDLQITPDGKHLLTIGDDDRFRAWDLKAGKQTATGRLITEDYANAPRLWSIQQSDGSFILLQALNQYREFLSFGGPASQMLSLSGELPDLPDLEYLRVRLSPRGNWVAGMEAVPGSWITPLGLYHLSADGFSSRNEFSVSPSSAHNFSPDGANFAVITPEGVRVVDTRTGRATTLGRTSGAEAQLAFSPVGSILALVGDETRYELWDYRTSKIIRTGPARTNTGSGSFWVHEAFFSARGRYLAVSASPRSYVFEVASGNAVAAFETEDTDGCSAASADDVYGFSLPHGAPLQLSPDERYAASCIAGELVVVNLQTGRRSWAPAAEISAFHLMPRYLAMANGHHVTIVQTDTMKPLARIDLGDTVSGVFFTPDQTQLITWGGATIRRDRWWGGPAEEACEKLTRNLTPEEWRTHLGDLRYRGTCPNLP
jgi:WD40 repeat protein